MRAEVKVERKKRDTDLFASLTVLIGKRVVLKADRIRPDPRKVGFMLKWLVRGYVF